MQAEGLRLGGKDKVGMRRSGCRAGLLTVMWTRGGLGALRGGAETAGSVTSGSFQDPEPHGIVPSQLSAVLWVPIGTKDILASLTVAEEGPLRSSSLG